MKWSPGDDGWGAVSQALHWLMVLLLVVVASLGLWMVELPNAPQKIRLYALHKSLGLAILGLALVRLAWRAVAGAPPRLPGVAAWQNRAAQLTHTLIYVLLLGMPLTGWWFNSAAGYPLQFFGLFNLPRLSARDAELRALAGDLHEAGFWVLLALVLLHASAALHHHFVLRDATLSRMLPRRRPRPPPESPHA